jgi:hypothetical protein
MWKSRYQVATWQGGGGEYFHETFVHETFGKARGGG